MTAIIFDTETTGLTEPRALRNLPRAAERTRDGVVCAEIENV